MGAIFIGILWLVFVFVVASLAKGKGRSYGGYFALSFFFSPLIGLIVLAVQGENKEALQKNKIDMSITKRCPFCANDIKKEAIVCQFCGKDLPKYTNKTINEIFKDYPDIIQKANEALQQYGKGTYISYLKDKAKELGLGDIDVPDFDPNFIPTHRVRLLTKSDGLSLRNEPHSKANPFTKIPNGIEIEHLETGEMAELNNISAPWFRIKTKDNVQGWCFSGSLEKL